MRCRWRRPRRRRGNGPAVRPSTPGWPRACDAAGAARGRRWRSGHRLQRDLVRLVGPINAEQGHQRNHIWHASPPGFGRGSTRTSTRVTRALRIRECLIEDVGRQSAPENSLDPKHTPGSKRSVYSLRRRSRSFVAERCVCEELMLHIESVTRSTHPSRSLLQTDYKVTEATENYRCRWGKCREIIARGSRLLVVSL